MSRYRVQNTQGNLADDVQQQMENTHVYGVLSNESLFSEG